MGTNYAQVERGALCDLFEEVGPDAPTLCEGWTTRDLAAHLVVRERRPDAALGIIVPFAAGHGENVRKSTAKKSYEELVELVRGGPPRLSPTHLDALDRATNTNEFFIHHEDVRRAADGWAARDLDEGLEDALWSTTSRFAKLTMRKAPVGVTFDAGGERRLTVVDKEPMVELRGSVGELVLFSSGRQEHALVDLAGPDDAIEQLRTARFGI